MSHPFIGGETTIQGNQLIQNQLIKVDYTNLNHLDLRRSSYLGKYIDLSE